jgi:hypothetical protein
MAVGTLYQKPLDAIELELHRSQLANIPYNPYNPTVSLYGFSKNRHSLAETSLHLEAHGKKLWDFSRLYSSGQTNTVTFLETN